MNIFISYASEDRDLAEQIYFALTGDDDTIFFDQSSLPAGGDYNDRIHQAMETSDLFIFLISPDSVEKNAYALTELKFASERWPDPKGALLPVMLRPTKYEDIPNYLKAVTVLEPQGNPVAEVSAWVKKSKRQRNPFTSFLRWISGKGGLLVTALALVILAALVMLLFFKNDPAPLNPTDSSAAVTPTEGQIAGIDLPAYITLDSAWTTKAKAQRRMVELGHAGYPNSGFFWIPDFDFLSGSELFQVYIGPFEKKSDVLNNICSYNDKFQATTYGLRLSSRPGRAELRCGDEM